MRILVVATILALTLCQISEGDVVVIQGPRTINKKLDDWTTKWFNDRVEVDFNFTLKKQEFGNDGIFTFETKSLEIEIATAEIQKRSDGYALVFPDILLIQDGHGEAKLHNSSVAEPVSDLITLNISNVNYEINFKVDSSFRLDESSFVDNLEEIEDQIILEIPETLSHFSDYGENIVKEVTDRLKTKLFVKEGIIERVKNYLFSFHFMHVPGFHAIES